MVATRRRARRQAQAGDWLDTLDAVACRAGIAEGNLDARAQAERELEVEMGGGITHGKGQVAKVSQRTSCPRSFHTAGPKFKRTSFWCRHGVGGELACLILHSACRWRSTPDATVARSASQASAAAADFPTSTLALVNVCSANRLHSRPTPYFQYFCPPLLSAPDITPDPTQLPFASLYLSELAINGHGEPR